MLEFCSAVLPTSSPYRSCRYAVVIDNVLLWHFIRLIVLLCVQPRLRCLFHFLKQLDKSTDNLLKTIVLEVC